MTRDDKLAGLAECITDSRAELADAIEAYGPRSPWVETIRQMIRDAQRQQSTLFDEAPR